MPRTPASRDNTVLMSDPLEDGLQIERARFELRGKLENLLLAYTHDHPPVVTFPGPGGRAAYGSGSQDLPRLFDIYPRYGISFRERMRAIGLSPSVNELFAEVCQACRSVRPAFPELVSHSNFRDSILAALKGEPAPEGRCGHRSIGGSGEAETEGKGQHPENSQPKPAIDPGMRSLPDSAVGTATTQASWTDLQAEFMRYAAEHSDLSAVWRWMYPALVMQDAVATALSIGPDFTPYEALRRMYRRSDPSTRPPAPKSQWTLEGGSPLSQDLFRVVAGRAAGKFPNPSGTEGWRLWLDVLRAEGYATEIPAVGASGEPLGKYPQGFENRHIERLFQSSADFCLVRSLAGMRAVQVPDEPGFAEAAQSSGLEPPRFTTAQVGLSARPNEENQAPKLNVVLIKAWMDKEGWINETLAQKLKVSERAVSSIRNNGEYHGTDAVTKLANLMGIDPADLYLPPEPPA